MHCGGSILLSPLYPASSVRHLSADCIDCVQNVFSKKLLSTHYNYINLQFYTSAAALLIQLPLMRRERLRLQAQQHGAGCRLVAFRHVEQTGGSSVREWMLRLDRMGQARFYGQTTRCAPPLADASNAR